jgi:hypothetical protein
MSLNIGGSGIIKPYCKYNAKADKWFVRGADGEDAEIQRPTFVIDLDNIATGWVHFREGQAPERVMPMGTTWKRSLSAAAMTCWADTTDTSCSPERPPKMIPSRSRLPASAAIRSPPPPVPPPDPGRGRSGP